MKDHDLVYGLPAREVRRLARKARKKMGESTRALLFWLTEVDRRKLFKQYGFSSTFAFAENELELDGHTVAELLRTARSLQGLPLLLEVADEIAPSKLREISRVCSVATQEFWIDTARSQPCRTVEKLVAITPKGGLPPVGGLPPMGGLPPVGRRNDQPGSHSKAHTEYTPEYRPESMPACHPESQPGLLSHLEQSPGCKFPDPPDVFRHPDPTGPRCNPPVKLRHKFIVELEADEFAILEAALRKAAKKCGRRDRAAALRHLAESYLSHQVDLVNPPISKPACSLTSGVSSGPTWDRKRAVAEPDISAIPIPAPPFRLVIHSAPAHGISWMESPGGIRLVSNDKVEEARCCGEILDLRDKQQAIANRPVKLRPKEEASASTSRGPRLKSAIPPSVRRMVIARDGGRCSVPGCSNSAYQHQHHITARSEDGGNDPSNLVLVCSSCHSLIHQGKLDVEGNAPDRLVWRNSMGRVLPGSARAA